MFQYENTSAVLSDKATVTRGIAEKRAGGKQAFVLVC